MGCVPHVEIPADEPDRAAAPGDPGAGGGPEK